MAESPTEIAAGALTLVVAGGFFAYATQIADLGGGGARSYPLTASFASAQGVSPGTDVRLAGIRVGSVSGMALNPDTFRADMTLAIQAGLDVPEDSSAAIASDGLLGATYVELVPGRSPFALEAGAAIRDTQGAESLFSLLSQVIAAAGRQ